MIIQNVFDLEDGLRSLVDKELPIPVAFKIQKNHAKVVDELKIANELRKKLINKYKESETDDGNVVIKKDKVEIFNKEYDEFLQQETDVQLSDIKLSELKSIAVTPRTLSLLSTILKEDES